MERDSHNMLQLHIYTNTVYMHGIAQELMAFLKYTCTGVPQAKKSCSHIREFTVTKAN